MSLPLVFLLLAQPGIEHRVLDGMREGQGPFSIHVLLVDARHPAINVVPVHAKDRAMGRETVLALAERYGAQAAVNGGYFFYRPYDGAPAGNQMIDGRLLASGRTRSALILCEEKGGVEHVAVAPVRFSGVVRGPGWERTLAGVNRPREKGELIAYTSDLGPTTLTAGGKEVVVDTDGVVLDIVEGGNAAIPPGGFVLSAAELGALPKVERGSPVTLDTSLHQSACFATDIVGAGPSLVQRGRLSYDEPGFAHASTRHPRTAAGIRKDGTLLFVTVDGRQAASIGMTIAELARLMLELGAEEAVNLDGGGSTTMVLDGKIVNRPSDPIPRAVSDAILIFSTPDDAAVGRLRETLKGQPAARRILDEAASATARVR